MFRKIELTDYKNCKQLVKKIHEIHVKNRPDIYLDGNPLPVEYFNQCITNNKNFNYLYEEDKKVIGIIMAEIRKSKEIPIMKERTIYYINDIVVDPNYRGKRIATKLYNLLLKHAYFEKVDAIELNVYRFNEEAIKFYQSLGMKVKKIEFENII